MFSSFRTGPVTSGSGLCYIERALFGVTKSHVKKLGRPGTAKNTYYSL